MELVEGDAFNRILLDRSRNRVRSLRFFEEVEITERQGSAPDRAIVEVAVKEQPTGELSFSAGFSSADAFLVDLSITQRNLRGRGQLLRFVIRASSNRREIDLRFTEPRFLGRNLAAGVELFDVVIDFLEEANFRQSRTGGQLTLAFPLTEYTTLSTRYSLRQEKIESPGVNTASCAQAASGGTGVSQQQLAFCDQINGRLSSIVGYTFGWDRRNDPITPTRGFDVRFSQDAAGVGGDVKYLRTDVTANAYRGLYKNVIASARLSGGYIRGWGGDPVSINDRYFKGNFDFRGYDNAGIGPRVVQYNPLTGETTRRLNALGGNAFGIAAAEVSFPVGIPNLLGSLFIEAGTVGLLDDNEKFDTGIDPVTGEQLTDEPFYTRTIDDLDIRAMAGASVFWESPFGPIRFDFTKPLRQFDYDDRQSFQFTTRTRF
jgi:outer membrane protein insertion porin family